MQLKGLLTEQPCICPEKIVHMYDLALAGPEAGESLVAFSSSSLFWKSRKGTFPRISALLAPVWVRTSGAGSLSAQYSGQGKTSLGTQPCSAASAWTWAGLRFTEPLFPTSHDKNSQKHGVVPGKSLPIYYLQKSLTSDPCSATYTFRSEGNSQ